jgi:hypothetical protein
MAFIIKPTATLTKLNEVERLFRLMVTPSDLMKRIKREKASDDKLLRRVRNS